MPHLWRCFPWDSHATPASQFSAAYVAPGQTVGRFDLQDDPPVRYLAESPDHAVGEILAAFRGTRFRSGYLRQAGRPLALARVTISEVLATRIVDCTNPATLAAHAIRPDDLAHHDRARTQAIARQLYDDERSAGLRWWSALTGAWHSVVIFTDRELAGDVTFSAPQLLDAANEHLVSALDLLGIRRRA